MATGLFKRSNAFLSIISACQILGKCSESFIDKKFKAGEKLASSTSQKEELITFLTLISSKFKSLTKALYLFLVTCLISPYFKSNVEVKLL